MSLHVHSWLTNAHAHCCASVLTLREKRTFWPWEEPGGSSIQRHFANSVLSLVRILWTCGGLFTHSWWPAQTGDGCPQPSCDGVKPLMFGLLEAFFLAEDFGWGHYPHFFLPFVSHRGDSMNKEIVSHWPREVH